jgi:hypothetical protein
MKLTELPLDKWVVVEPVASNEVRLLSTHESQHEAEWERDRRNEGLSTPRYSAVKALAPVAAGALGCAAGMAQAK